MIRPLRRGFEVLPENPQGAHNCLKRKTLVQGAPRGSGYRGSGYRK
ncbi:hypothetical protein G8770_18010 [Aestuariicella hydrocarbonica]|uniref:Uncharacterized protein n=1 Tax=Pseudomaricurvus hydrocarbonicus TaxID=1470433 RepID=A0A9E5T3T6_9GAMM|nr:hypothetical protein [Aestuariicella hydrocarbonica]NHO67443.1 hypothetical protein [Aestuariicella hydrocarbonica]